MHLKTLLNYGLRIVIFLAMQGRTCASREISEECEIPRDYLLQICQLLKKAGILQAQTGKNGGYRLARKPSEITLLEVISALENKGIEEEDGGNSPDGHSPVLQSIMDAVNGIASTHDAYLDTITLQSLIDASQDMDNFNLYVANTLASESERLVNLEIPLRDGRKDKAQSLREIAVAKEETGRASIRGVQSKSPVKDDNWVQEGEILFMQEGEDDPGETSEPENEATSGTFPS